MSSRAAHSFVFRFQPKPLAIAIHLGLAGVLAAGSITPASAQTVPVNRQYIIAAGPLDQALTRFAQQAGVAVSVDPVKLKGLQTTGLRGSYGVEEGFAVLLRGSGYAIGKTSAGYVLIPAASADARKVREAPSEKVAQLATIEVKDNVENGYVVKRASTATKTDTPLMQTPMTVEVLPKEMLQEMGVVSTGLSDVVKYFGVTSKGTGPLAEDLNFRGFATSTTLWNGFRIEDFGTTTGLTTASPWMGNIASVEVIKGPSSILYGRAEPGGAINVLTNRPQAISRTTVTAGIGSWSDRWLGLDSTGAINDDKTLLYRLNVADEEANTWFRWNGKNRSQSIATALEWRVSPQTTLSYEGLYRKVEGYSTNASIPWDTSTRQMLQVDPGRTYMPDSSASSSSNRSTLGLTHQFDEDWSISWKYMHDLAKTPKANYVWAGSPQFPVAGGVLTVSVDKGWNVYDLTTDATLLDVTGHVNALGIKHTILVGADYYKKSGHQRGAYDFGTQTTNFFNPELPDWNIPEQYQYQLSTRDSAIYLQDQMELPGNWHVLLGGRYQRLVEDSANNGVADPRFTKSALLPRLGLLWQALPWLSAYYSYSENLGSNNGRRNFDGILLKPESSKQHELGLKSEWLDGRLSALLSVFDLTKYNVAFGDPAHPGFNIAAGEVRSTGYEFNLQGAITDNWSALVNYSYARPEIKKDIVANPINLSAGTLMPMVSNRTFGIWTSYRLPQEALQGWKIGGGYHWASAPTAYPGSPFSTSSYETVSAFASYDTKVGGYKTTVQLNVDNLLNERYQYMGYDCWNSGIWSVTWGTPRQFRLSLRTEF